MAAGDVVLTRALAATALGAVDAAVMRNMAAALRGSAFAATEVRLSGACACVRSGVRACVRALRDLLLQPCLCVRVRALASGDSRQVTHY